MDQAERDHIQHELEIAANELFAGWIRRVEVLQHDEWGQPPNTTSSEPRYQE